MLLGIYSHIDYYSYCFLCLLESGDCNYTRFIHVSHHNPNHFSFNIFFFSLSTSQRGKEKNITSHSFR